MKEDKTNDDLFPIDDETGEIDYEKINEMKGKSMNNKLTADDFSGNLRDEVENRRFFKLNSKLVPQIYFVLNDRFVCEFDIDPELLKAENPNTYVYASEAWIEENSKSRRTFMLDVIAYDTVMNERNPAKWYISYDKDTDFYSSSLFFYKAPVKTSFTIVEYKAKEVADGKSMNS